MDIWIDSLCTNQDSASELEERIPRMDQIYRQASRVFIFLTNLSETAQLACETLYYVASLSSTDLRVFPGEEPYNVHYMKQTSIRSCLSEPEFGRFAQRSGLSAGSVYAFCELVKVLTNRFADVAVMPTNELVQKLAYKQELPSANHSFWRSMIELMHHAWFYIIWPVIRDCRRAVLNWQMESAILGSEQTERLRINLGHHPFLMTHHFEQFRWEGKSSLGFLVSQSTGRKALHARDHV